MDSQKNFAKESKEQEDRPEDTGICSTFPSKQDEHATDQNNAKEMSTPSQPNPSMGTKVSPSFYFCPKNLRLIQKKLVFCRVIETLLNRMPAKLDLGPSSLRAENISVN